MTIKIGYKATDGNRYSFIVTEGREAKCGYCGKKTASKLELPFFKACPDKPYDEYYCGCWGWD